MRILRTTMAGLLAFGALSLSVLAGSQDAKARTASHDMTMATTSPMTKAQKITNAMSAAPSSVSAKATILDWPVKDGEQPPVLRAGSNGWTCFPDMPQSSGNDPMCLDAPWMKWLEAYLAHEPVAITTVGVSYMLAPGGAEGSNSDPYAMKMTPDNHWGHHAPHVMIAVPDVKSLDALPTDPKNGGPYVMWKGTPYAHIMAPVPAK
jgi:hypothetical protein